MITRCITLLITAAALAPGVHTQTLALARISPVPLSAQIRVEPEPVLEIGGSLDEPEDQYEPPMGGSPRWDVLEVDGTPVASVELPEAYRVLDIGTDQLLGIRTGPLDMEILAMHAIAREGPSSAASGGDLCDAG